MIRIHTLLIGQPQTRTDAEGTWTSAIFRTPVAGPVLLTERGLAGDAVADTKNHGTPGQAVCCYPLAHYAAWNGEYGLEGADALGPGSVGENWTLSDMTEMDVCVGDLFAVGAARVQVTAPRIPCWKQGRKLGLPDFQRRTEETGRTGFYCAVLTSGLIAAGDAWALEARPHPSLTIAALNACAFATFDPALARAALAAPALLPVWRRLLQRRLTGRPE